MLATTIEDVAVCMAQNWMRQCHLDELSHKTLDDPWEFEKSLMLGRSSWRDYIVYDEVSEQTAAEAAHMLWLYVSAHAHDYLEIPAWICRFVRERR